MHIRTRLILSYAFVIALCLTLAAGVSALLLRRYQGDFVAQRIAIIAETTAPLLHDNNDPARFDADQQVAKTAELTNTRMVVLSATLRDLTVAQQRPGQAINPPRQFTALVTQDTAGLLAPGATVAVPRRVYEEWQAWTRSPAAQATRAGTPAPLKNELLALPSPTTARLALRAGQPLDLALIPLRAERGSPGGEFRVLVVAEPSGAPLRPFAAVLMRLGWTATIVFLIAILVATLLARSITRPLLGLTRATRALAGGDYTQRVPVRGDDEVAELGGSFNQLAQDLQRLRARERDLLANISHDLKTPLTSIQGFSGALTDGTVPTESYPAVARIIHDEAQRMGHLVNDIVQLSRLDAGELALSLAPVELADLLQAAARRFASRAQEAGVTIRVDTPPARPPILLADRARLEQVLGNLIENALRYTPPGGRIDLVAGLVEGDGPERAGARARLIVRDTGAGIAPDDLARIFERFYQADKARVSGPAGAGLGLAIVKELVERHGGTVRAESTPGAGTAIVITLPYARPDAAPGAPAVR